MKWIAIDKRKPSINENVFTLDINKKLFGFGQYQGDTGILGIFDFKTCYDEILMNYEVTHWHPFVLPPTTHNSGYMVRIAFVILSKIAKATSYIRKRCMKFRLQGD